MPRDERKELYRKMEEHRKCPLIAYVTSKRAGVDATIASDALPYLIDQLERLPRLTKKIDFLIVSLGGDPMVAWRMMSLMRQRVEEVSVLIPQSAYSAATLIALGADEIVMHPYGHLGPVDMQISAVNAGIRQDFSTEDISSFLNFVKENLGITDQRHIRKMFEVTCGEVGSIGVGFTARSSKLAAMLGQKLLAMPKSKKIGGDSEGDLIRHKTMVENLSREFQTHSYPISRDEALTIGLPVNATRDNPFEDLMWELWLDLEAQMMERTPFNEVIELLKSDQATTLLSPIPQYNLPINAPNQHHNHNVDTKEFRADLKMVNPIDYESVDAIMESSRLLTRGVTRGKILASRTSDMNLQWNRLVTFKGWENTGP